MREKLNLSETLKKIPLFSSLPPKHIKSIEKISTIKNYPKNSTIFTPNTVASGFYILKKGKVKIFKLQRGKEQIIKIFSQPAIFGEAASFTGNCFPAWAETLEDSEIIFVPREEFLLLMKQTPEIALNLLAVMSNRLIYLTKVIESLSLKSALSKVASYIVRNQINGELEFKTNLAALELGLTKETVSRMLSKLKNLGVIEKRRSKIVIKDLKKLKELE